MPNALVLDDDLFFAVRIETTLQRLGYAIKVIPDGAQALAYAQQTPLVLAIVNFNGRKYAAAEIVSQLKTLVPALPVLCFMPHKQFPELRPKARAAGADLIVANSALTMRLPQLIAKLAPLDGSEGSLEEAARLAAEAEAEEESA